jgi:hypothetical protein
MPQKTLAKPVFEAGVVGFGQLQLPPLSQIILPNFSSTTEINTIPDKNPKRLK